MSRNKIFVRRRPELDGDEFNIWTAFTDLMSNSFLILSLFLIISFFKPITCPPPPPPPIILLRDSGLIRFPSGKSNFDGEEKFREFDKKDGIIDIIEKNANDYGINLVEIIGHTDPQPISIDSNQIVNIERNLDKKLSDTAKEINVPDITSLNTDTLTAGSNADLGMMRAVHVMRVLRYHQKYNGRLRDLEFRAYSAAQLVPPKLSSNAEPTDEDKRRIEIRFTRLDENNTILR